MLLKALKRFLGREGWCATCERFKLTARKVSLHSFCFFESLARKNSRTKLPFKGCCEKCSSVGDCRALQRRFAKLYPGRQPRDSVLCFLGKAIPRSRDSSNHAPCAMEKNFGDFSLANPAKRTMQRHFTSFRFL